MVKDLSYILTGWPLEPGVSRVRKFTAPDGLTFIQVRVDLGVLQMAIDGRPDGERPSGYDTVLECLRDQVRQYAEQGQIDPDVGPLNISAAEWQALIREVLQYYRRRVSLIALAREAESEGDCDEAMACYRRAIRDAEHNLAILDFLRDQCSKTDFMEPQEPYRPFILMQRAICRAEYTLLMHDPDAAIELLKQAVAEIEACATRIVINDAGEGEPMDVRVFVAELKQMERRIRRKYGRRRTLNEQLQDALAGEDYEKAAKLRDALSDRAKQQERS
jgi:tetratricopeptide (TPR) repeat protein